MVGLEVFEARWYHFELWMAMDREYECKYYIQFAVYELYNFMFVNDIHVFNIFMFIKLRIYHSCFLPPNARKYENRLQDVKQRNIKSTSYNKT